MPSFLFLLGVHGVDFVRLPPDFEAHALAAVTSVIHFWPETKLTLGDHPQGSVGDLPDVYRRTFEKAKVHSFLNDTR
jgi:hypothetical protein